MTLRLGCVALDVLDLGAAAGFWTAALGWSVVDASEGHAVVRGTERRTSWVTMRDPEGLLFDVVTVG